MQVAFNIRFSYCASAVHTLIRARRTGTETKLACNLAELTRRNSLQMQTWPNFNRRRCVSTQFWPFPNSFRTHKFGIGDPAPACSPMQNEWDYNMLSDKLLEFIFSRKVRPGCQVGRKNSKRTRSSLRFAMNKTPKKEWEKERNKYIIDLEIMKPRRDHSTEKLYANIS